MPDAATGGPAPAPPAGGAAATRPAVLGVGCSLPANTRDNDDPIFDWLKANHPAGQDLFKGYNLRHVLSPEERLIDLMVPACLHALADAGLSPRDIDLLIGYPSVGEYITPNELARLHNELGLSEGAEILPIANEFTNFNSALLLADALVRAGRCRNALLMCASNWTRYVNYHTPQSVSAADGAGAAVVGSTDDPTRFTLVDTQTEVKSDYYGVMYMQPDRAAAAGPGGEPLYTAPYFHITPAGAQEFTSFGGDAPPDLANRVLGRNGLKGSDVTLISHQASSVLMDRWRGMIEPAQYVDSLADLGNMTLATLPVNLARYYGTIQKDYVLLLGVGAELHTTATLLRRGGA